MSSLLYFAIIALQLTNSFAIEYMPLKCFFTHYNFLVKHDTNACPNDHSFDVLRFDSHDVNKDGWIFETRNVEIVGFEEAVLDEYSINFVTKFLQITFTSDYLLNYDYRSSGHLFSRPIEGEGILEGVLEETQIGMNVSFEFQEINGEQYIVLKNFNMWYIIGHAVFKFSNLYHGDKKSGDEMHFLINDNWEYIVTHFGKTFMERIGEEMFKVFKNYLLNQPVKDVSKC